MMISARIDQDQTISKDLTMWNQQGSQVLRGQVLVLPIDNTFLYVEPIYLQPLYQQRVGYGRNGFPFKSPYYEGSVSYDRGICPVTERMYFEELIYTDVCHAGMTRADLVDFADAIEKVLENANELA